MSERNGIYWTNEKRRLGDLIPWPINPRQIKKDQAARLSQSLDEFAQVETIAVGPGNEVYNGHQRLNVWMAEYGPDFEVDVRVASRELSEDERKKLTVFLHKGAAGEWDFDLLANNFEVDDLIDWGFDAKELDLDLWGNDPPDDPGAQIDRAEELREKWGVESGQLWQLGEHRLICGDCTDAEVVKRVMGEDSIALVVTSPPYDNEEEYEKGDSREDWKNLIDGMIREASTHLMTGGNFSINMGNRVGLNNIGYCGYSLEANGLSFLRRVVWKKPDGAGIPSHGHTHNNPIGLNWHPMMVTEDILIYFKNERRKPVNGERFDTKLFSDYYTDCWQFRGVISDKEQGHPAAFPELLPILLISFVSVTNDIVYDPFLGSGTTLIACERLGRKCRAVEISPAYCAVAIQRWVDMTGGEPVLLDN